MRVLWFAAGLTVLLSVAMIGCGGSSPSTPPMTDPGIGKGPPMGAGQQSPLMSGSHEAAEKLGRGPGRGELPEGSKDVVPAIDGSNLAPSGGPGGGAAGGPPN